MVPVKTGYTSRVFVWFVRPYSISPHLFSSPLQCLLASLLSLLYLCCFLFAFSDFFICPPLVFLDGYISISLRTVSFPAILGLFRHEWLTTASFLFSVFALLSLLSLRVQCHFSLFLSLHGIRSTSDFDILPWPPPLSHGAYSESLSVYVILSCMLLIMFCPVHAPWAFLSDVPCWWAEVPTEEAP